MNKLLKPSLFAATIIIFSPISFADWQSDCSGLSAPNLSSPCQIIEQKVAELSLYMPPEPFLAKTINEFGSVDGGTSPFSTGSPPWGEASSTSTSGSGGTGSILPPSQDYSGDSSQGSTSTTDDIFTLQ